MASRLSARALRAELGRLGLKHAAGAASEPEVGFGRQQSVVYTDDGAGAHGNFLAASYRRIVRNPDWARRLDKAYKAQAQMPRAGDRVRGELECATSSDALLMNIFCYPGVTHRAGLCALLGVERGLRPSFGVRASLPMRRGEVDRTELDMQLGTVLFEAKLTEGGFGKASAERLGRYEGLEVFDVAALPRVGAAFAGYQLIRGILAAVRAEARYVVLLDGRRVDLVEPCFGVLRAVRWAEVRGRLRVVTWQEVAELLPAGVRAFLAGKYGIGACR